MPALEFNTTAGRCDNASRAFVLGNNTNSVWGVGAQTTGRVPNAANVVQQNTDGLWVGGDNSGICPDMLRIFPMAEAAAGYNFAIRVWVWYRAAPQATQDATWWNSLLAEFACVTCNTNGPFSPPGGGMQKTEFFCDSIVLAQGQLGARGSINSMPGTDSPAYVELGLAGARFFQFDCQQLDQNPNVGMNIFWTRV